MKVSRFIALFVGLAAAPAVFGRSFPSRGCEAVPLAIAHFDASHAKCLNGDGPEARFMAHALEAVDRKLPILTKAGRCELYNSLYASAISYGTAVLSDEEGRKMATLEKEIPALTQGCGAVTENQSRRTDDQVIFEDATVTYDLKDARCRSEDVETLLAYGIDEVKWRTHVAYAGRNFQSKRVSVQLTTSLRAVSTSRDMVPALKSLQADPRTRVWADLLTMPEYGTVYDARESQYPSLAKPFWDIGIASSSGQSSMTDPIRLVYSLSWGEGRGHSWQVTAIPRGEAKGKLTFDVELTEESGDPLPEEWVR